MSLETLLVEHAGQVAIVTVNRPEKRNALNAQVRQELVAVLTQLERDSGTRVVVLTGAGEQAFVAGADVAEFASRSVAQQQEAMAGPGVFDAVASCALPVIAMINGLALGGGCELAQACDLRIAAHSARLGQPEIRLGLIPGGGGTQRLPRLIGAGRALRLILTGEAITASEALAIGLVDEVHPDDQLRDRTLALAELIAGYSPVAVKAAREAVRLARELPLQAGLRREQELFLATFASADGREGIQAFLEKRAPRFGGH